MDFTFRGGDDLIPGTNIRKPAPLLSFEWIGNVAGNWALAGGASALVLRGAFFTRTLALRHIPSPWNFISPLPFSVTTHGRGVLLLTLDVAFYKGLHPAFQVLTEQYRLIDEWLHKVDDSALKQMLGPFDFDRLTDNGLIRDITILVDMPPAHLVDP